MHKLKVILNRILFCCTIISAGIIFLSGTGVGPSHSELNLVVGENNETSFGTGQILFQKIPQCSCERLFYYPPSYDKQPPQIYNSSCSDEGTFYQNDQRVVTFTMWYGPSDKWHKSLYKEGIQLNLQRMREFYPGHSMRLYTDIQPDSEFCPILCKNSDLFWCDIKNSPSLGDVSEMYPANWRFLTLGDPTVEYFLSRDLDSVIIEREVGAVHDWLQIGKPIHLMRDKWKAHNIPILAGMWGARNNLLRGSDGDLDGDHVKMRDDIISKSKSMRRYKGQDQLILNKVIFYPRKKDIVAHDSYHCKYYGRMTMVRPFPTRKMNGSEFVGNYNFGRKKYELVKCPKECRPSYGKDWEYC